MQAELCYNGIISEGRRLQRMVTAIIMRRLLKRNFNEGSFSSKYACSAKKFSKLGMLACVMTAATLNI